MERLNETYHTMRRMYQDDKNSHKHMNKSLEAAPHTNTGACTYLSAHSETSYSPFAFELDLNPVIHQPYLLSVSDSNVVITSGKPTEGSERGLQETNLLQVSYACTIGGLQPLPFNDLRSGYVSNPDASTTSSSSGSSPNTFSSADDIQTLSDDQETSIFGTFDGVSTTNASPNDEPERHLNYTLQPHSNHIQCTVCGTSYQRQCELK